MPRVLGGSQGGGRFLMNEVPLQVLFLLGMTPDEGPRKPFSLNSLIQKSLNLNERIDWMFAKDSLDKGLVADKDTRRPLGAPMLLRRTLLQDPRTVRVYLRQ